MTSEVEEKLRPVVEKFVAEKLNGRYRGHASDLLLVALLMQRFRQVAASGPDAVTSDRVAYSVGCLVFESLLEHGCRAGGNGHHVAQNFAQAITEAKLD